MKKSKITAMLAAFAVMGTLVMTACTPLAAKGELVLKEDGTGSRKITGVILKNDNQNDGYGEAYHYLKKHGAELQTYIEGVYEAKVDGSENWLDVTVTDGAEQETIELAFDFTSFNDYVDKLGSLVKFGVADAAYTAPTLTEAGGQVTYTESTTVITSAMQALQKHIMDDTTVFDIDCTIDGEKGNTKPASKKDLFENGIKFGEATLSIKLGNNAMETVSASDNAFTLTGSWSGGETERVVNCVFDYSFNDTLDNAGTLGEKGNLSLGTGSSQTAPAYVEGVDGKGYYFDGTSYLASPNETYSYKEMTISFYYKMEEYFKTDTGANMIIVPAGLGALGAGMVDLEFIQEEGEDLALLVKMTGSNWQNQDKLYVEEPIVLNEWHCYTVVFQNQYDDNGVVEAAYLVVYIDGARVGRMELSVAAGLKYSLGKHDGSATANGGFNVGGYYEDSLVKRGAKGTLDNLKIFSTTLTADEVNELCYTVKLDNGNEGGDSTSDGSDSTPSGEDSTPSGGDKEEGGCGSVIAGGAVALVSLAAASFVLLRKRK